MKYKILIICSLIFLSTNVLAVDEKGDFALKGVGLLSCKIFVKERELQSKAYYMIGGWIDGYFSAYNRLVGDTYDIASFETPELLAKVIDNHCRTAPEDRLYAVVNSMLLKLHPGRLIHNSPRVEVIVGKRKTHLYRETISRMQAVLKERGLFNAEVNGKFNKNTIKALKSFQDSLDFENTGFPDQTTLWRLFK